MFRREIKAILFLVVFLLGFTSCGTAQILGLHRHEAGKLLRNGDLDFITQAELPADFSQAVSMLGEISLIHPAATFYAALLAGGENRKLQTLLFAAALESPSPPARHEATLRLLRTILEAEESADVQDILGFLSARSMNGRPDVNLLRAASHYRLGRYAEAARLLANPAGEWEQALAFFAAWRADAANPDEIKRQEIISFLFGIPAGDLRRWAYTEALALEGLLKPGERGIIFSRRFPVSHRITLNNMRPTLADGGLLFFRYPALIGDLARAYQFTPDMREEGLALFAAWDSLLENSVLPARFMGADNANYRELEAFVRSLDSEAINARRYLILHHSGRIERARGRLAASSEFFRRALAFAPDTIQSDACYWYILMNTLAHNPSGATAEILATMPGWSNLSVFNGILDRLSRQLVFERRWDTMLEVFNALESKTAGGTAAGTSLAQYAWIVGRAVQEGFLATNRSAESFFRVAFEQENGSVYYRTLAALQLGENFSPFGSRTQRGARRTAAAAEGSDLEFLLGFFEYGAASFALPFIRTREAELPIPELRKVATALAAENLPESMRLVARYKRRHDYRPNREDFYLSHPRPFVEIVERNAAAYGIGPELLFGLIRTESFFSADVVSHAGAVGLAQLMPATAVDIAARIIRAGGPDHRNPGGINLTNPEVNVHLGSFYLRHLIVNQMGGNPMLALKAYNGGQGRVRRWLAEDRARPDGGLPLDLFLETLLYPETRNYGRLVLGAAAIYGYLYYGMSMEDVAVSFFQVR